LEKAFGSCYVVAPTAPGKTCWWSGYDSERACIIEEFNGDSMPIEYLKLLVDGQNLNYVNSI